MSAVKLVKTLRFGDDRGWFSETYSRSRLTAAGIDCEFVQDNQSYSAAIGTVRGIHFQAPPHAQAKLIRCLRGAILDYAIDLRKGSPTYGRWLSAELTEQNGQQLFIPVGFGHAFVTLTQDAEIAYKVSAGYSPESDGGVRWDDPQIGIDWPLPPTGPTLSDKDKILPFLSGFDSPFDYDGEPMGELDD